MRKLLLLLPVLAAGCADLYPPPVPPHFEGKCDAAAAQSFVGQAVSQDAGTAIKAATRATFFRWAAPNTMLTMDFSPVRVTVHYGSDNRISQIVCG
ncbi:MAG: I78 family peptidase inhibitor [Sphingomicrobium sp.]